MILIEIENIYSRIVTPLTLEFRELLYFILSYEIKGAHHSDLYKKGMWNGRKSFLKKKSQIFPTGLCSRVIAEIERMGEIVEVVDKRIPPTLGEPIPLTVELRNYQKEIQDVSLECQRGIVCAATGSGKSYTFASIIGKLHIPTMVFIHRKAIAVQLQEVISKCLNCQVGLIGAGQFNLCDINIGMIQTACSVFNIPVEKELEGDDTIVDKVRYRDFLERCQCIIVDEAHNVPCDTYMEVLGQMHEAYYRWGFTATPFRHDNADLALETMTGRKIIDISASRLIKEGYLAKPTIYFHKFKHNKQPQGLNYTKLYSQEIVENERRNNVVRDYALKYCSQGKKVLVAVRRIKHGEILLRMLEPTLGDKVRFVNGTQSGDEVFGALKELGDGRLQCVIATVVYNEGVDCPQLDVCINAKNADSPVDAKQLVGRVLRKTETKSTCDIIDIADEGCRWFGKHSKSRLELYQTEPEFEIKFVGD